MYAFDPTAVGGKTRGEFDSVDFVDGLPGLVRHPQPTVVPRGASLLVSGWTVDPVTNGPPLAVRVVLDRVLPFEARTGIARGDVKLAHKTDEFVGYQLTLPTGRFGTGAHELRTYALSTDGKWYESALAGFRLFDHHRVAAGKGTLEQRLRLSLETPCDLETGRPIPLGTPIYANRWVALRGWAVDQETGCGIATIVASDESGRSWSGPADIEDPVASESVGAIDVRIRFEVILPAAVFGRGRHAVTLTGLDAAGFAYPNSLGTSFDVISALRPFPLTARVSRLEPAFAARLRIVGDASDIDDKGPTRFQRVLPTDGSISVSPLNRIVIEGWALDETGDAADEVFIELTPTWLALPPRRHPTECARAEKVVDMRQPSAENAWFRTTFDMPALPGAVYELALAIVQPGRRTYSRAFLATLLIK